MSSFISDGYTEVGYIAAFPGVYEPLRFRFRRSLGWENAEARRAAAALKPRDAEAHWAKFLKSKLVDWELHDQHDKPVELTEAHILRMNPTLNEAVLAIVMSIRAPDADPEATETPTATVPPADAESAAAKN